MNGMRSCILAVKDAQKHFKSLNIIYLKVNIVQASVLIDMAKSKTFPLGKPTAFIYTG